MTFDYSQYGGVLVGRQDKVLTITLNSSSAIASSRTTSHGSCVSTWPARSSSCGRCMISTIAPASLSLSRL